MVHFYICLDSATPIDEYRIGIEYADRETATDCKQLGFRGRG
jgi:hypothetical protein